MSEHKTKFRLDAPKPALRTNAQKLRYDIQRGRVHYLHVSVRVGFDPIKQQYLRTPLGSGSTARYPHGYQKPKRVGAARRQQQRLMRAAHQEIAA